MDTDFKAKHLQIDREMHEHHAIFSRASSPGQDDERNKGYRGRDEKSLRKL